LAHLFLTSNGQTAIQGRKVFFFEKKKQKTFEIGCCVSNKSRSRRCPHELKVFWFFFSKKNAFLNQIARPISRRGMDRATSIRLVNKTTYTA
jgi:hypothetical protein